MSSSPDEALTPEQRRREVAAILAQGYLRLKRCPSALLAPEESVKNSPDSGAKALAISRSHALMAPRR